MAPTWLFLGFQGRGGARTNPREGKGHDRTTDPWSWMDFISVDCLEHLGTDGLAGGAGDAQTWGQNYWGGWGGYDSPRLSKRG